MRRSLVAGFLLLGLCFGSCEDKKKTSDEKTESTSTVAMDTVGIEDEPVPKKNVVKQVYPEITDKNVVQFLTQYGKDNPETRVRINTHLGEIDIELYNDTPLHRANFIYLTKQNYFNNTFFHRVVPNFIIQAGNSDTKATPRKRSRLGKRYRLPAELDNGRKHQEGTVSGAKEYRENPDKKSAPYEFFIFLGPQSSTAHLNGNYTIFGRVTKGMDVVEKIANLPSDEGDWPLQNVYITVEVLD
ncbi:MAG: peptidylprolyl isomerase [Bacteroidia bacterium]|nr:peptidylprolyl isomerase [Bacteroidia bacterium]